MKTEKFSLGRLYEAPSCEAEICPQESLCADSYGAGSEDYTDGGDFTW